MKNIFRAAALLAVVGNACAIEAPPVLLIVNNNIGVETPAGTSGLLTLGIAAWANSSVNKQSAVKVARFNTALGGMDFVTEARRAFGCVGANEPCADRAALTDVAEFEAALAARPGRDGVVVNLTPELVADQLMMRAATHSVVLSTKKTGKEKKYRLEPGAGHTAVFYTRLPGDLWKLKKTNPAELEQHWINGEPRRIVSDARRGFTELNALLAMLAKEGGTEGKMPPAWKDLPRAKEFKESGRIACAGIGTCPGLHVLKDNGDSFVLVCCGNVAGWFDAAAVAKQSGLGFLSMFGIPEN